MSLPPNPGYWQSIAELEHQTGNDYGCWLCLLRMVWEDEDAWKEVLVVARQSGVSRAISW